MEQFIVLAHRSAASVCGAAEAPVRDGDYIMRFDSREAAQAKADEWTSKLSSPNVWYTVAEAWQWECNDFMAYRRSARRGR